MLLCRHVFNPVAENSKYQYCKKCGKAILAPCIHDWVESYNVELADEDDNIVGYTVVYICDICKNYKKLEISI